MATVWCVVTLFCIVFLWDAILIMPILMGVFAGPIFGYIVIVIGYAIYLLWFLMFFYVCKKIYKNEPK